MKNKTIVIMAAVAPLWSGKPRQMVEINGEPLLYRTIRLLREQKVEDLYITVPKLGIFGDTKCKEVVGTDGSGMGRFLNFKEHFQDQATFLYGDVYYTREAIDTILKDGHSWRFFGRTGSSKEGGKGWGEPFAMTVNRLVMRKAEELKERTVELKLEKCICWDLYRYLNDYPVNAHYVKDNFTEISDLTDDIDYLDDYENFKKRCEGRRIYYCEGMKFFGERAKLQRYNLTEDIYRPTLFLGLYFKEDYEAFKNHKGDREVFWNGSDVLRLIKNPKWIEIIKNTLAVHFCHNKQLQDELKSVGIEATIQPIFFGDIKKYPISYRQSDTSQVYMVAHLGREEEYGVPQVLKIAKELPKITFHIYGIGGQNEKNIIYHGQVEEEVMDNEIKDFQGCIRLNLHDGFSQTVMKAILMGQYVIKDLAELQFLKDKKEPNNLRNSLMEVLK